MSPAVAVGFDLGETLLTYAGVPLNWSAHYRAALASVATRCAAHPEPAGFAHAADILARHNTRLHPRRHEVGAEDIFREILAAWSLDPAPHLAGAIAAFFEFFQQHLAAYPESAEVLGQLRTRGIRTGVLTDVPYGMPRPFVQRDLDGAGLNALLDAVLTSVDVGWRKPESAGFRALALRLGVPIDWLWYVGNEEKDVIGARGAGAISVLIDREDRRPQWGQHYTLRSLRELPALL